jgi:hypothetical protein
MVHSETPTQQVTENLGCACLIPSILKFRSWDVAPLQNLVDKMDAVDFAVAAVSPELVTQTD